MKRTIITFLILISGISLFAKDRTSVASLKKIFDKKSPTYEFDVRNPLFKTNLYVTDLKAVKGKILRSKKYTYDLDSKGIKSYGDGDPITSYKYYIFDNNGFITDYYYVNENALP